MNTAINIHNYEEFFLLYVDNELSANQRAAVDAFVLAHPDLAVELEMLQQAQLGNETWVFNDKESLYRKESEGISLANYEEQFLLFVDNELSSDEQQHVEKFVLQHPALQEGFTQLQQTKLPAETIVFPYKESLYRKEEKERRVFYMSWQRIAAAAVFIGVAVAVWMFIPQEKNNPQSIARVGDQPGKTSTSPNTTGAAQLNNAATDRTANAANAAAATPSALTTNAAGVKDQLAAVTIVPGANKSTEAIIPQNNNSVTGSAANTNTVAGNTTEQAVVNTNAALASNETPVRAERGETVASGNRNSFSTVAANTERISEDHANTAITAANTDAAGGPNNIETQPAVYRELDTDDEKKSLLLGSIEINKDKLRGFFRKAGSIFRSKKADDEKTESRPSSTTRSLK